MNKPPKPEDSNDGQQQPRSLQDKDLRDPLADLMPTAKKSVPDSDMEPDGLSDKEDLLRLGDLDSSTSLQPEKGSTEFDVGLNDNLDPFVDARVRKAPEKKAPPEKPSKQEVEQRAGEQSQEESARRIAFAEQFLEKSDTPHSSSKAGPKTRDLIKAVMPMRLNTGRFRKGLIIALGCVVAVLCILVAWKLVIRPSSTVIGGSLVGENKPDGWEEPEKTDADKNDETENVVEAPKDEGPKENTPTYFFGKGVLEHNQGKLSRAEHFFRKALELDEKHPGATAGLASVLVADGFLEEAQGVLQDLQEFVPNDALVELNQGLIEYQLGNKPAAQNRLRRFLSMTPESKHAHDVKLILTHLFTKPEP